METRIPEYLMDDYFKSLQLPWRDFAILPVIHSTPYLNTELHRHNYFQIVALDQGLCKQTIDFAEYQLVPNSISVMFPNQFHTMVPNDNARGEIIIFNESLFSSEDFKRIWNIFPKMHQKALNYIELTEEQYSDVRHIISEMKALYSNLTLSRKEQIKLYLRIFFMKLSEISNTPTVLQESTTEYESYLLFLEYMECNFKSSRKLAFYSNRIGVTPRLLTNICKRYNGHSAMDMIHIRLFVEIKRMMTFNNVHFKDIAYDLGFDSQSALNKFIMKMSGLTPKQLKEQLTNLFK